MYISMCGALETGFLHKISVRMPKLSQKPGFLDLGAIFKQVFGFILHRYLTKLGQFPGFYCDRETSLKVGRNRQKQLFHQRT